MNEIPDTRDSLIVRVRDPADRDAWEQFARIYRPVIYRLARGHGLQDADAQDLAQRVLISVASAIPNWERSTPKARFRHWLRRVATNEVLKVLTRQPKDRAQGGSGVAELLDNRLDEHPEIECEIELEYRRQLIRRAAEIVRSRADETTWLAFSMTMAHDLSLDRVVAIKVLAPHLASSGAARKRFAREAKAAAAVLHPNVIAIHGVSNDAELPYLVMPYVCGQSLQRRLDQNGPLTTSESLRIGQQIASGLAAAHAQGLVHRDIKPANIMLEEGVERVTITDFGLARAVDDATMTRSGVIAGTPQYMSPEQARGEAIDARSDLFSLGSVLYAMCTGHSPFRAGTSYGVLHRITHDNPRPIQEINSEVPLWFTRLIERFHAKSPDARIQIASQAEQLLLDCIAHMEQPDKQPLPGEIERPRQTASLWRWAIATATVAGTVAFALMMGVVDHDRDAPIHLDGTASQLSAVASDRNPPLDSTSDTMWNDPFQPNPSEVKAMALRLGVQTKNAFSKQPFDNGND